MICRYHSMTLQPGSELLTADDLHEMMSDSDDDGEQHGSDEEEAAEMREMLEGFAAEKRLEELGAAGVAVADAAERAMGAAAGVAAAANPMAAAAAVLGTARGAAAAVSGAVSGITPGSLLMTGGYGDDAHEGGDEDRGFDVAALEVEKARRFDRAQAAAGAVGAAVRPTHRRGVPSKDLSQTSMGSSFGSFSSMMDSGTAVVTNGVAEWKRRLLDMKDNRNVRKAVLYTLCSCCGYASPLSEDGAASAAELATRAADGDRDDLLHKDVDAGGGVTRKVRPHTLHAAQVWNKGQMKSRQASEALVVRNAKKVTVQQKGKAKKMMFVPVVPGQVMALDASVRLALQKQCAYQEHAECIDSLEKDDAAAAGGGGGAAEELTEEDWAERFRIEHVDTEQVGD